MCERQLKNVYKIASFLFLSYGLEISKPEFSGHIPRQFQPDDEYTPGRFIFIQS